MHRDFRVIPARCRNLHDTRKRLYCLAPVLWCKRQRVKQNAFRVLTSAASADLPANGSDTLKNTFPIALGEP